MLISSRRIQGVYSHTKKKKGKESYFLREFILLSGPRKLGIDWENTKKGQFHPLKFRHSRRAVSYSIMRIMVNSR